MRATYVTVAALTFVAFPAPGMAQSKLELTPFAGVYLPTSDVLEVRDVFTAGDRLTAKHQRAVIFGGRLAMWVTERVAVEGSFGYSPSKVEATYTDPGVDSSSEKVDARVIVASGRVLLALGPQGRSTSWHVVLGGGVTAHGGDAWEGGSGTTNIGGVVGFGGRFRVSPAVEIRVDVEDNLFSARVREGSSGTQSDARFQNDLVISAGLSIPFGGGGARRVQPVPGGIRGRPRRGES
jgi:hypothetical protein